MDPLGARPAIVDGATLPRWGSELDPNENTCTGSRQDEKEIDLNTAPSSPFPVRQDLNNKIALWKGDIAALSVEAVVNPTNEALTDKNPVSLRLQEMAGPELKEECRTQIISCRTGEAKIGGGYNLPARHVIHTVGPRYNLKYKTAAESALYNCYRSVLQVLKSRDLSTLAVSTLTSSKRGYPPYEGAHIAIRTIRRFLEHYSGAIDLIVFVEESDTFVYKSVLPLYFPRTKAEEAIAARTLPEDIGDSFGEPVIVERKIRISDTPLATGLASNEVKTSSMEAEDDGTELLVSDVGSHPFAQMSADHDQERKEKISHVKVTERETYAKRYQEYLKRGRTENFTDIVNLRAFYKAGEDIHGRQIVTFVGRHLPVPKIDMDKALCYFIHVMDDIAKRPFVMVYFHSECESENLMESSFLKEVYALLEDKYRQNMKALYFVHANWWLKMSSWWFLTFTASEIKDNVVFFSGVQYLFDTIKPNQIEIPKFVMEYDAQVNGKSYYTPRNRDEPAVGGEL